MIVTPAKAGVQFIKDLDSRLRGNEGGNDGESVPAYAGTANPPRDGWG